MENKDIVVAIDLNNVIFSSYYGQKLINSRGENVNAIKGFFFKLKMLREMFNPKYIVMANDLTRDKTFRRQIFKEYKANRTDHDPDILRQLKYAKQMVALLGFPIIDHELYEADDILGMISQYCTENNLDVVIITSDRDLYQLINDNTFIYSPTGKEIIDKLYMQDYYGLTPDQWIEYKMLKGDRGDNIPGLRGIGDKTALQLMQQYGSIDEIYNHIMDLKPGIQRALEDGKEILPLTRQLVTIIKDYTKIGFKPEMMERTQCFRNEIYDLIYGLEISSLIPVMEYNLFY